MIAVVGRTIGMFQQRLRRANDAARAARIKQCFDEGLTAQATAAQIAAIRQQKPAILLPPGVGRTFQP